MVSRKKFAGKLICFKSAGDGAESNDADVVIELTDTDNGVELAFNDRDERTYLSFRLEDLMIAVTTKEST